MGNVIYSEIITSNGKQKTTKENEYIEFKHPILCLTIEAFNKGFKFKVDTYNDFIEVDANSVVKIDSMQIESITILEDGAEYRWVGMY